MTMEMTLHSFVL